MKVKPAPVSIRFVDPATLRPGESIELHAPTAKKRSRTRKPRHSAKTRQQVAEMNAALDRVSADENA